MIVKSPANLFYEMGEFAKRTFPDAGPVEHLKKLEHEAVEAQQAPADLEEYADCLLCLFGAARKAGFGWEQLIEAGWEKFEKVQTRKWNKTPDGTYQHQK